MSIPGRDSTVAMLARAGFVVVLMPVNVSGFRLVLARGWHGQTSSLSGLLGATAYLGLSQVAMPACRPGVTMSLMR
jgi:hypothetical protein